LDEESGKVHNDHRAQLLPILMRILYGKFHSAETTHTSSRDTKSNKRSTIIQFLSSCNEFEMNFFFNLIFDCVQVVTADKKLTSTERFELNQNSYESAQIDRIVADICVKLNDRTDGGETLYDLKRVIPFKKLLGVLQSLEIVMKKLARQMENFAHRILQILCFIHKYCFGLNEIIQSGRGRKAAGDQVDDYHVNLLKIIRQKVTLGFKQFFETFDHLSFSQHEYFFAFDSFVWPQALRLPIESATSVSNLLKIFASWSERSIYYPLLVLKVDNFTAVKTTVLSKLTSPSKTAAVSSLSLIEHFANKSVLDTLFQLLDSPKCSHLVINFIIDMIHNLVTYADFKEGGVDDEEAETAGKELPFDVSFIRNEFKDS
jgi:hypothetical protein